MKLSLCLWLCLVAAGCHHKPPQRTTKIKQPTTAPVPPPQQLSTADVKSYGWLQQLDQANLLVNRIAPPPGYERAPLPNGLTWAGWLRHLPLLSGQNQVLLYTGQPKANQSAHAAVINMDVGSQDLQQCADAVIRLRAEFLRAAGRADAVRFASTSGQPLEWSRYASGDRPTFRTASVAWSRSGQPDSSYAAFRHYLDDVFKVAGTVSLARQLSAVGDILDMRIGDVFIKPGTPGHAAIVVDMAVNARTGKRVFLLAQGFMPAQEMHVLVNPAEPKLSPWYNVEFGQTLRTPEWTFKKNELKRF